MIDIESEDDWNPQHDCKDTIIDKIIVKYSGTIQNYSTVDKQIKKEIEAEQNNLYNPDRLLQYAQSQVQESDEEDPEHEFISQETKQRYQKQFLEEQVYYDPL